MTASITDPTIPKNKIVRDESNVRTSCRSGPRITRRRTAGPRSRRSRLSPQPTGHTRRTPSVGSVSGDRPRVAPVGTPGPCEGPPGWVVTTLRNRDPIQVRHARQDRLRRAREHLSPSSEPPMLQDSYESSETLPFGSATFTTRAGSLPAARLRCIATTNPPTRSLSGMR